MTLTATQREVVRRLKTEGTRLRRLRGGFWCTDKTAINADGVPVWSVDIRTVRAMETRHALMRVGRLEEWRDDRVLTPEAIEDAK